MSRGIKRPDADEDEHPVLTLIKKNGWTRKEAARKCDMEYRRFNQVIDRWRPTNDDLKVLFNEVFEIPIDQLVGIKNRPPPPKKFSKKPRKAATGAP